MFVQDKEKAKKPLYRVEFLPVARSEENLQLILAHTSVWQLEDELITRI